MPRKPREKSNTGIYHIILRGINRQTIFEDDEDAVKFQQIMNTYKKKDEYKLYAYCLMGNHIHLLIKEENEEFGTIMRRIGASYVYWYNLKYNRTGHYLKVLKEEGLSTRQLSRLTGVSRGIILKA